MKYRYVAIEREYGSAGTQIGGSLAGISGIPCYGREIIDLTAKQLGIEPAVVEQYEEKATNSLLYTFYLMGKMNDGSGGGLSREGTVYLEEQRIIAELAASGPAIFVGRCACKALAGRDDVLHVFLHADREMRLARAVRDYGIPQNHADAVLARFDRKRSSYYGANTGKKWKDWANYELVLDSGKLGPENCVEIIWKAMNGKP